MVYTNQYLYGKNIMIMIAKKRNILFFSVKLYYKLKNSIKSGLIILDLPKCKFWNNNSIWYSEEETTWLTQDITHYSKLRDMRTSRKHMTTFGFGTVDWTELQHTMMMDSGTLYRAMPWSKRKQQAKTKGGLRLQSSFCMHINKRKKGRKKWKIIIFLQKKYKRVI